MPPQARPEGTGACPYLAGALALPLLPSEAAKGRPGATAPLSKQDGVVSAVSQAFRKPQGRFAWVKLCAWRRLWEHPGDASQCGFPLFVAWGSRCAPVLVKQDACQLS